MIYSLDGFQVEIGSPYQLGANRDHQGCNFALFSKNATAVELLLFQGAQDGRPSQSFKLNPLIHRTGDVWHIYIYGIPAGQLYGYVVDGPFQPAGLGHRFNKHKLLVDPYAKAVEGNYQWQDEASYSYLWDHPMGDLSFSTLSNFAHTVKGVVVDPADYEWDSDKPINIPMKDVVIYEVHLRGFTQDPSSGVVHKGSYLGMIEKIPYLKELGVTTIEILPVHEFNQRENVRTNPETGEALVNFWGYTTLSFFSPAAWFASDGHGITAVQEFKTMVKAFHEAGMEVILDVVYNHTGEGNEFGPIHSFKGLDNTIYYMLEQGRYYKNYSGCGNTLNCNHPVVRNLILDSLRYWVVDMHVDGFRFDLAAILGRNSSGEWMPNYSVLNDISLDPILSNRKIIAEGWDAGGLFKVGGFPVGWAEWNAHYRDDVRSFVKSEEGMVTALATRMAGSSDLFFNLNRRPYHSINFITAHDGFTLHDLVSYNHKHNYQNGEDNRDGNSHNLSWNCGTEGLTRDRKVVELRDRQMKNLMAILMLSQGTPMILYGDEMGYSKLGNNNTYCHDNTLNWLDWNLKEKNNHFFEFTKFMIHFRKRHLTLGREHFFVGMDYSGNPVDINWMGVEGRWPDWSWSSRCLAFLIDGHRVVTGGLEDDNNLYVALNFYWEAKDFVLPANTQGKSWTVVVNTDTTPGFWTEESAPVVKNSFLVKPRSLVVLIERDNFQKSPLM